MASIPVNVQGVIWVHISGFSGYSSLGMSGLPWLWMCNICEAQHTGIFPVANLEGIRGNHRVGIMRPWP